VQEVRQCPRFYQRTKTNTKQTSNNNEVTKENQNYHPSIAKQSENVNSNRMQVGLDLGFHGLILWGWFGCITESGEVLNVDCAL
jgi:hypothetical protein